MPIDQTSHKAKDFRKELAGGVNAIKDIDKQRFTRPCGHWKEAGKRAENFYILYKGSSRSVGMCDPDLRVDAEPIHEPFELFGRELSDFGRVAGP